MCLFYYVVRVYIVCGVGVAQKFTGGSCVVLCKYVYVPIWPICQLRPIVIQEISAENTVGLCLEAGVVNKYGVKQSPPQQQKENEKRWRM